MAGARQPTAVLLANGKKHLSQAEIAQRQAQELTLNAPEKLRPPKWLDKALRVRFAALSKQLCAVNLVSELDADMLGRYVVAHSLYEQATARLAEAMADPDADVDALDALAKLQARFFGQADTCAKALGLCISARCKLVIPIAPVVEQVDPMFGA